MSFLKEKNARYLLAGRTASSLGDSIYQIAVIWYIYELTKSTVFTGIAVACISIPQTLNFLFGPVIDASDKKKILVHSQLIQFILMAIVPLGIIFHFENVYLVLIVITLLAFVENYQGTAEVSIVPQIIEKKNVGSFNSFNNSLQEIINLAFTGSFSIIILYVGIRDIYLFNALTFLLACLFFAKIKYSRHSTSSKNIFENSQSNIIEYKNNLKEGLSYFLSSKLFIISLPFMFANGLMSGIAAILPDFANSLGDSNYYGFLMFSISIGLLIGSIISPLFMKLKVGTIFIALPLITSSIWTLSLLQPVLFLTFILFSLSMVPFGIMNIVFLTLNQNAVDESLLSRTLSISDSFLFITIPIGAVITGIVASATSPLMMMYIGATSFLIISIFYFAHPYLRTLPTIEDLNLSAKEHS
ncbi:MFS transporter [Salipaludibacillus agaradhaerens]|uniref:MFS transporter n=1 Tax=Salipaludibacillus agaradhaerens TaxID=76935 RepID=A0A9Q4B5E6_SALAG|nr:MFS transporter [Salipaludibacillus agaradhaerens]MCR6098783.1 MFS transporter [Salipaludibacillus agaradhaerens]MCR6115790.1 MFS transporter [Salipaludibacillus agaradhaerens]